jgi:hypothetical protein
LCYRALDHDTDDRQPASNDGAERRRAARGQIAHCGYDLKSAATGENGIFRRKLLKKLIWRKTKIWVLLPCSLVLLRQLLDIPSRRFENFTRRRPQGRRQAAHRTLTPRSWPALILWQRAWLNTERSVG